MITFKPEKLNIDREKVLSSAGCQNDSPVYNTVCEEYDKLKLETEQKIFIEINDKCVYVLITVGEKISDYSKTLMDKGECLAGLLVNAYADEAVFALDEAAAEYIKRECAKKGLGVSERTEISPDMDIKILNKFMSVFSESGISLTSANLLNPPKSMGYILTLTDNKGIFNAQHDCASCGVKDCPRRNVNIGRLDILSDYRNFAVKIGKSVICIDIGTTTIVLKMITHDGRMSEYAVINMQKRFGTDVISRINAANCGRAGELREIIVLQLIKGIKALAEQFGEKPEEIVIAGNTVMTHLLLGYPCNTLGVYPFTPYNTETVTVPFNVLMRSNIFSAPVTVIGGISSFVGGDVVSGLYMCDFDFHNGVNLFIDLGTNGEMVIGNREKLITASAAAGPAFEGGRISCGVGSVDGAICGVDIKSGIIKTVNDKEPCGICGTGIVEAISEFLKEGIIDKTGLFKKEYFDTGYPLTDRIVITQNDIREIQAAKSAVRTGVELLISHIGTKYDEIENVYIAGGFGYGLNPEKACNIGLIPKELKDKVIAVGNSSLGGAIKYALSEDASERVHRIQMISKELSVARDERFNEMYLKNMYF